MLAQIIDVGDLAYVVWVSALAGVGLSLLFSLTIAGAARANLYRREGRTAAAAMWLTIATFCGMGCGAAVVAGVIVMLSK